jgi:hypothetical protein
MRELFDEVAGKSPLDPQEAVRRSTRGPLRKRFYTNAGVGDADNGFSVTLDGRPIKTPSGHEVNVPARSIADAIAAEWNAQGETIDPLTMPLTRFANSVVEGVADKIDAVADDIAKYLESDLLFCRGARGAAGGCVVDRRAACDHGCDRLGAARFGVIAWSPRSGWGLGGRPCRRGLEHRKMGGGWGGGGPAGGAPRRLQGRGGHFGSPKSGLIARWG